MEAREAVSTFNFTRGSTSRVVFDHVSPFLTIHPEIVHQVLESEESSETFNIIAENTKDLLNLTFEKSKTQIC